MKPVFVLFLTTTIMLVFGNLFSFFNFGSDSEPDSDAASGQTAKTVEVSLKDEISAVKNKVKIRFLEVLEDSRCPDGADCVWAGNAKIKVQICKPGDTPQTFEFNTALGASSVIFNGYEIVFVDLLPHPRADGEIKKENKTARFSVKKKP